MKQKGVKHMNETVKKYEETNEITRIIKHLHQEKGVSLSFIARKTGLSQPSLTKLVQGKKKRMLPENRAVLFDFFKETFGILPKQQF